KPLFIALLMFRFAVESSLERADLCLMSAELALHLRQFVHDHDTGHDRQPEIADFPELALEVPYILVKATGKIRQVILLPLLACHAIGLAVDIHRHLSHGVLQLSAVEDRPYGLHRRDETP